MGAVRGMDAKLYRNTGSYGSPVWNEITVAKEVTVSLSTGEADVTTRGNNGWRATIPTLKELSIDFILVFDSADTSDFDAVQTAFLNGTSLDLAALSGSVLLAGSQGPRAVCSVINFSRAEPLEDAIVYNVTAKPAYSANPPTWFTVT